MRRAAIALRLRQPEPIPIVLHPLDAISVRELMVPRALLRVVTTADSELAVRAAMHETPNGHLPVLEPDGETVVGYVDVVDLAEETDWSTQVQNTPYLFEGASARVALRTLRGARATDAAVLDEHGGFVGWMTDAELATVSPEQLDAIGDGSLIDGTVGVHLLAEALGIEAPPCHSASIGGLITEQLGHFAQAGESIELDGWTLTVVDAVAHRVLGVRVDRIEPERVEPVIA